MRLYFRGWRYYKEPENKNLKFITAFIILYGGAILLAMLEATAQIIQKN